MQPYRPELHASGFRAMLEAGELELDRERVDQLIVSLGVTRPELEDPNGWFSLEFAEAMVQGLVDASGGDPVVVDRAAKLGISKRYLGILYPLFRSFGSPAFFYRSIGKLIPRLNKVTVWTTEEVGPQHIRITVRPREGASTERTPWFCRVRQVQLSAVAGIFDLPPAEIEHTQCLVRGGDACVYEVICKEHRRNVLSWIGLFAGVALGIAAPLSFGTSVGFAGSWIGAATFAPLLAFGGFATGRAFELRRALDDRLLDLDSAYEALSRSSVAHEHRFGQLMEAKAEVEKKVDQRTRQLQEASLQLSDALSKLQELDRTKTDFFNNVSHELRSPLTLILAPLEELLAGHTPPGGNRTVYESMHRNASRLLRLINQLLDLAKIDAGEMRLALTPVDLPALVRASVEGFEAAADRAGVRLTVLTPDAMAPLVVDAAWIDSAITNLIANALRVTTSGGSVRVTVGDGLNFVTVAVADDGPGIAASDRPKIFERFAQGDSAKRVIGGTGIGLALVREATRMHGGDVELASEVGIGSTFALKLPRGAVADVAPAEPSRSPLPAARVIVEEVRDLPGSADRAGPPGAPLALVVEDNPELRAFIADVLSARYRVRAASDGAEGLELARSLRPDVVVSDVAMPEMDGFELCRRLRLDERTKVIPVLLVTARTEVGSVLQGFDAGANDYVLKPFHATELMARVDVHVRLRRLVGQLARQERLAALGSLAASVAHNVRNPLSALISGLPAIRSRLQPNVDASTSELMTIMLDCAERIERMTLDLLDLSRIDREVSGEFSPGAGLRLCIRMLESRVTSDVLLRTEIDDKVVTAGRPGDMNHVFMNVIDNALRAVCGNGVVEVCGRTEADRYVVTVSDSGSGVSEVDLERIFEPFYTTRSAGEGTGLGLSIARQIVDEHGGSIVAGRSALGGALFTIRLPLSATQRAVA
jgi:signal transduction histidine kinase